MTYIITALDRYHVLRFAVIGYIESEMRRLDDMIADIKLQLSNLTFSGLSYTF